MQTLAGSYSIVTVPKSGWPVLGQIDVNSVPVIVTFCTSGAGNASAFSTSRAALGFSGRGSGPDAGSFIARKSIKQFDTPVLPALGKRLTLELEQHRLYRKTGTVLVRYTL